MTLVTLRPNGTVSNTGVVTGAGGVAHTALSDNSDATQIQFTYGSASAVLAIGDLTLPAGAVVKSVQIRMRTVFDPASAVLTSSAGSAPYCGGVGGSLPNTAATFYFGQPSTGWTKTLIDAATLAIQPVFGAAGSVVVYEAYVDVRIVNQPVVTVTAPTGTVTNTNTPLITWVDTLDADGGAQTASQKKVFSAAQYGAGGFDPETSAAVWDSTVNGGPELSRAVGVILPNATYRAYVKVAQTVNGVGLWSAWAFSGFIVNVAPPAVPTVALTTQAASGRIQIVITTGGGATSTDRVELQRSIDGGVTWLAVRNTETTDGTIAYPAAPVTILDYEAPNGQATSYRARALHSYTGVYAASAWSATATATWSSTSWWLKHPLRPALNLDLTGRMSDPGEVVRAARQGVFQAFGATLPIVVSDTRMGATGQTALTLLSRTDRGKLDALIDSLGVLLLQAPYGHGWTDRYIRIDNHSSQRLVPKDASRPETIETIDWTQVNMVAALQVGPQYP